MRRTQGRTGMGLDWRGTGYREMKLEEDLRVDWNEARLKGD